MARLVSRYDLLAVPVVDADRRLLGIVTIDDVLDVIKEEALEDMMLMAGVSDDTDPTALGVVQAARQRFTWLTVTRVGGIGVAELIGECVDAVAKEAVLAASAPCSAGRQRGHPGRDGGRPQHRDGTRRHHVHPGGLFGDPVGSCWASASPSPSPTPRHGWTSPAGRRHRGGDHRHGGLGGRLGAVVPLSLQRLGVDPAIATGPSSPASTWPCDLLRDVHPILGL